MEIERRFIKPMELRIEDKDGKCRLTGYAAVFNSRSEDMGFFEEIAPGAFAGTIKVDDIRCLFNHDASLVLGRSTAGTLRLSEDARGLKMEVDLPDTQLGRDLRVSINRGDVSGQSIGFIMLDDEWRSEGMTQVRTVKQAQLHDVGPVTFPAYTDTTVATRELEAYKAKQAAATPPPTPPPIPNVITAEEARQRMAELT